MHHGCITRLERSSLLRPEPKTRVRLNRIGEPKTAGGRPWRWEAQKGDCLMSKMTQPSHRRTRGTSVRTSSHGVGCSDATRRAPAAHAVADAPWTQRSAFAPRPFRASRHPARDARLCPDGAPPSARRALRPVFPVDPRSEHRNAFVWPGFVARHRAIGEPLVDCFGVTRTSL
jgi:hypothetical protein